MNHTIDYDKPETQDHIINEFEKWAKNMTKGAKKPTDLFMLETILLDFVGYIRLRRRASHHIPWGTNPHDSWVPREMRIMPDLIVTTVADNTTQRAWLELTYTLETEVLWAAHQAGSLAHTMEEAREKDSL